VLVIEGGLILEDGAPPALAAQPNSRYARLLAAEKRALGRLSGSEWRRFRVESGYVATDWKEREPRR